MYKFLYSNHFARKYKKLLKSDPGINKKARRFFVLMEKSPFSSNLKTHKVISKTSDIAWSSMVTGDLRIIWDFSKTKPGYIDLLDIGGHSGKGKVYK